MDTVWAGGTSAPLALPPNPEGAAHQLLHSLGAYFGYGTLLLAVGVGLSMMGRKHRKKWLGH